MSETVTFGQVDTFHVEEIVGDHEIPCDFSAEKLCSQGGARWVLHKLCPSCSDMRALLSCDACKDARMSSEIGVVCKNFNGGGCGEIIAPARKAYHRVEAL